MSADFNQLADIWVEAGCYASPSALHGWLAGLLAAGGRLTPEAWLQEAEQYLELSAAPNDALAAVLHRFYQKTLETVAGDGLAFQLLLPADDDADIDEQVECLAQWSKGFLDGFGAAGTVQGQLPEDVAEVLSDLDAFSQAELEDNDPNNELIYLELTEHARVGALLVFYTLNQGAPNSVSVH